MEVSGLTKVYRIPFQYVRKDFPLLFPKCLADEFAIRGIADSCYIDYYWFRSELDWLQRPHESKEIFKPINRRFRNEYRKLFDAVMAEGQMDGIDLSTYGITLPKNISR